jgi:hypothetical protein
MLKHCVLIGSAIAAGLWAVPTAAAGSDAMVLYSAGIDGILDDSKDAGLHAALLLMEQHGLSLPPDVSPSDALGINTVVNMLLSESELRMRVDPSLAKQGQPPFSLTISSGGNAGWSVEAIQNRMDLLLKEAGTSNSQADPAQLSEGYGLMAGLMAAVSNYTRPRSDAKSGVVMTLPTYNELVKDARPCALVVRPVGDDLVYTGTCDSSINDLMTSAIANWSSMLPLVAPAAIGMVLPAVEKARETAREAARRAEEKTRRRSSEHEGNEHEGNEHGKDGK